MKNILAPILVVVGLLLLVLGLSWSSLFPPARNWTPEQNERLIKLGGEVKKLRFAIIQAENNPNMHGGENAATLKAKHAGVREEYDVLQSDFESVRDAPAATGGALKWVGIVVAGLGAVLAFLNKQDA